MPHAAQHFAVELTWSDTGWDGHICNAPLNNSHCLLRQGNFREFRSEVELPNAGKPGGIYKHVPPGKEPGAQLLPDEKRNYRFPCWHSMNAFGSGSVAYIPKVHNTLRDGDRTIVKFQRAKREWIPARSVVCTPYQSMLNDPLSSDIDTERRKVLSRVIGDKLGLQWLTDPVVEQRRVSDFWRGVVPDESLVFFYCRLHDEVNRGSRRVLIGAATVLAVSGAGFQNSRKSPKQFPIWSRIVTHGWPHQGFRVPLPKLSQSQMERLTRTDCLGLPAHVSWRFTHYTRSIPAAIARDCLERLSLAEASLSAWGSENENCLLGRAWLERTKSTLMGERLPRPNFAHALRSFGVQDAETLAARAQEMAGGPTNDPWPSLLQLLDNETAPEALRDPLEQLRSGLAAAPNPLRQWILALSQIDAAPALVVPAMSELYREEFQSLALDQPLTPYALVEQQALPKSYLESHGNNAPRLSDLDDAFTRVDLPRTCLRISEDNPARQRAEVADSLLTAASLGSTKGQLSGLKTSAGSDEGIHDRIHAETKLASPAFVLGQDANGTWGSLRVLHDAEREIADAVHALCARQANTKLLDRKPRSTISMDRGRWSEVEQWAIGGIEVVSGPAGSGKTTVLRDLANSIATWKARANTLILSPTGRASAALRALGLKARTVHAFLAGKKWLDELVVKLSGKKSKRRVVIIEEASMIDSMILATLFRALDLTHLDWLILIGDPGQLPPIDAGRPFVDIYNFLKRSHPGRVLELTQVHRTADDSLKAGQLARTIRQQPKEPANEPVFREIRTSSHGEPPFGSQCVDSSLHLHRWCDSPSLDACLNRFLQGVTGKADPTVADIQLSLFMQGKRGNRQPTWQLLCPTRDAVCGTQRVNEFFGHVRFLEANVEGRAPVGTGALVGNGIVFAGDKVIQVRNEYRAQTKTGASQFICNGELGTIVSVQRDRKGQSLTVQFADHGVSLFRYKEREARERLELAYTITVHKAQGAEFDVVGVVLPMSSQMLSPELLYTATTRHKRELHLFLEVAADGSMPCGLFEEPPITPEHSATARRMTLLRDFLAETSAIVPRTIVDETRDV